MTLPAGDPKLAAMSEARDERPESERRNVPARVRALVRHAQSASLSTLLARDGSGHPYVSLVVVACDPAATPILLLSDLADHSRNLAADPRAALLFDGTAGLADPLAGARVALLGR
ncbi:MAG: pyridoxamine 5'-phosphate oxidase family protein, partial [Kiloniellales bacterium]